MIGRNAVNCEHIPICLALIIMEYSWLHPVGKGTSLLKERLVEEPVGSGSEPDHETTLSQIF